MNSRDQVDLHTIQTKVQKLLRSQGKLSLKDLSFFERFKAIGHSGISPSSLFDQLEQFIGQMRDGEKYADLLKRRFWKKETIRQVAYQYHLSTDQLNRLQHEAIASLAQQLLDKDAALRSAENARLAENLPPPSYSRLFGSEPKVRKITQMLIEPREPWVIAICGIGGIGKTALADAAVRSLISHLVYDDVVWARAVYTQGEFSIWENLVRTLARELLPEALPPRDQEKELRRLLRATPHLLVLDSLDDERESQEWMKQLSSLANPSRFLITTRNMPIDASDIHLVQLSDIDQAAAKELLGYQAKLTGLGDDLTHHSDSIYQSVGGNPLALKLVVGLLHSWSLPEALTALRKGKGRKPEELFRVIYSNAWNALSNSSRTVMQAMLLVGEEGAVPRHLAAITGLSDSDTREAIQDLATRSLLEMKGSVQERSYGIHRLTETYLDVLSQETTTEAIYTNMASANIAFWQSQANERGRTKTFSENTGNLYKAIERGFEHGQGNAATNLLIRMHSPLLNAGLAVTWIRLFELAYEASLSSGDSELICELLNQIGSLHWQSRKYDKALDVFDQSKVLAKKESLFEKQVDAHLGLALVWWAKREYPKAERMARELRRVFARRLPNSSLKGRILMVLGIIAFGSKHYVAAEKHFRAALIYYGLQPLALAQLHLNRGICQQMRKRTPTALKQYRLAEVALGAVPVSPRERVQIELVRSSAFYQMGDLTNAQAALQRAISVGARLTDDFSSQAFLESSLGRVYFGLGKKREGKRMLKSAVSLWKKAGVPELEMNITGLFQTG